MIASLSGIVLSIGLDHAVIECGGVGYLFSATPATLGTLRRGEKATVMTVMTVREDAMTLYGFHDAAARDLFGLVQVVSGVGPKLALAITAMLTPHELAEAIRAGDIKRLTTIPGVGKRMAERLALELKDKVGVFVDEDALPQGTAAPVVAVPDHGGAVVEALCGLGFTDKQAQAAVTAVYSDNAAISTADALKAALKHLGS